MMMWPWFDWGFGGFWWIMPIIMVVFWGLVIWGIVFLIRKTVWSSGNNNIAHTTETALEILKRRYARGEIGKEEFEEKKSELS